MLDTSTEGSQKSLMVWLVIFGPFTFLKMETEIIVYCIEPYRSVETSHSYFKIVCKYIQSVYILLNFKALVYTLEGI